MASTGPMKPCATDVGEISCHDALRLVHEYLDGELEGVPEAR